jgi:hypothetical protein
MAQYTKGPWFVDPKFPGDIQAEGTEIAWFPRADFLPPRSETLCNARLISKAPEMFEYLQTLGTPFAEDLRKFVLGVDGSSGT